jgi:hypothetical protein
MNLMACSCGKTCEREKWTFAGGARLGVLGVRRLDAALSFSVLCCTVSPVLQPFFRLTLSSHPSPYVAPSFGY